MTNLPLRPIPLTLSLLIALSAGCSSNPPAESAAAREPSPTAVAGVAMTVEGQVTRIDTPNRLLTVRGVDGNEIEVHADESVRNFEQIRKGDIVALDYLRAITVDIQPAGSAEPGAFIQQGQDVARTGERPRFGTAEVVTVLAPIRAIDVANNTITVEGPRGNVVTLDVQKPEHRARLPQLKVGDMLRIAFTEAAAVSVRPKGK